MAKAMLIMISLIYLLPFYMLILMSLKHETDYTSKLIPPAYLSFENFIKAWNSANIFRGLINNTVITVGTILVVVILGAMASYPLSRYRTRLNTLIYTGIVSLIVIPNLAISVSLYRIMIDIHAIDSYWGMILVITAFQLPVVIFLYSGFIATVPRELDEAAILDGCSYVGVFFRVIMPLLKPTTATVVIFVGVAAWNDYGNSLFYLQTPEMQTMTLALSNFFTEYRQELGSMAAGCIINAVPVVIVFFLCQKYFIKGLAEGAIK